LTWQLKDGTVEQQKMAIAKQRHSNHVFAATNKYATIEKLLGIAAFYAVQAKAI
jgi:hypothetical protein